MYLSLNIMHYISTELLYVCQTVGVRIGKWIPDLATSDDIVSNVRLNEIGSTYEI